MDLLAPECAATSVGTANQLFQMLIQTIIAAQCGISPKEMWPKDYGPTAIEQGLTEYDFIVVGAGSGGSVVANRLSENEKWKVLLLEAGGDPPIESEVPFLYLSIQNTRSDWQFETNTKNGCRKFVDGCRWPRGKMIGGSHGMNAMIYLRGNHRDYDQWEHLGNPTWGWNDVLEYFKKSEANQNAEFVKRHNGKYHSDSGLQKVDTYGDVEVDALKRVYIDAAAEFGHKYVDDFNGGDVVLGMAHVQGTVHKGTRQSVAKSFLLPASNRPNLHIIKHAHATRVEINESGEAIAINFVYNGTQTIRVKTRKEIILSAGAISTPQLLMLSGIGPAKHLKKLNIPVKKDLAVGKNLQDHFVAPMFFHFERSKSDQLPTDDMLRDIYNYAVNKNGKYSNIGLTDVCGFFDSTNNTGYPDIQTQYAMFNKNSLDLFSYLGIVGYSEDIQQVLIAENTRSRISVVYVVLLNPESRGEIQLKSSDPMDKPNIFPNYADKDKDMVTLLRGVKQQYKLIETQAFKAHEGDFLRLPLPECDKLPYLSDDYFKCYITFMGITIYHPVGTAKMGPSSDKEAVVNSQLRIHGVQNLRVIDASIMPKIVSSNTNAPTIMIGEKGADFIKDFWQNDKH